MLNEEDYQHILHEVKNSITLINSSLQLIEKKHPEVKSFDYWEDTCIEVTALKELAIDISYARKCDSITKETISFDHFLQEFSHSVHAILPDDIAFHVKTDAPLPAIDIDPIRLQQALLNLIKNAYEAISEEGSITLYAHCVKSQLLIEIQDNGCGMDSHTLSQIFIPFYTTKETGTGLGLIITQSIIKAHGGSLTCQSVPHKGTTFCIRLPL